MKTVKQQIQQKHNCTQIFQPVGRRLTVSAFLLLLNASETMRCEFLWWTIWPVIASLCDIQCEVRLLRINRW